MTRPTDVKPEHTGWRDEDLSRRHRMWGRDAPFADLDFTVVEYDHARPVALIEFKRAGDEQTPPAELKRHPTIIAIERLANAARIPFLLVYYKPAPWLFACYPVNAHAHDLYEEGTVAPIVYSEFGFVTMLYELRKREVPDDVLVNLGLEPARKALP